MNGRKKVNRIGYSLIKLFIITLVIVSFIFIFATNNSFLKLDSVYINKYQKDNGLFLRLPVSVLYLNTTPHSINNVSLTTILSTAKQHTSAAIKKETREQSKPLVAKEETTKQHTSTKITRKTTKQHKLSTTKEKTTKERTSQQQNAQIISTQTATRKLSSVSMKHSETIPASTPAKSESLTAIKSTVKTSQQNTTPFYHITSLSTRLVSASGQTQSNLKNNCSFNISSSLLKILDISKSLDKTRSVNSVDEKLKKAYESAKNVFKPTISPKEKGQFQSLMKIFHETLYPDVPYVLYGGTLLGSYRYHGMIPWDDDLDLFVDLLKRPLLEKRLQALGNKYLLNKQKYYSWKFTFKDSIKTHYGWNWPFLDIFFYKSNISAIWDTHPELQRYKYKKSEMFPLKLRPFMGMLLPAPKDTTKALKTLFDMNACKSPTYNHKKESSIGGAKTIPCKALDVAYPSVERRVAANTTYEIIADKEGRISVFDPQTERFANL